MQNVLQNTLSFYYSCPNHSSSLRETEGEASQAHSKYIVNNYFDFRQFFLSSSLKSENELK